MEALKKQVGGSHYKTGGIQPIEFILANDIPFCEGNAIKYLCRWRQKGGIDDLKKAIHYIEFLIEEANQSDATTLDPEYVAWRNAQEQEKV